MDGRLGKSPQGLIQCLNGANVRSCCAIYLHNKKCFGLCILDLLYRAINCHFFIRIAVAPTIVLFAFPYA